MIYQQKFFWAVDVYPVSAEVAASEIEKVKNSLHKDNIEPKDLLDASRADNAPLHCCFEWNDSIAAEKFRVNQARHIISNIRVEVIESDKAKEPITVRPYVNVSDGNDKGYFVSIQTALEKGDYRYQILKNAATDLTTFKKRYGAYNELFEVCNAIDNFIATLK